MLSVQVLPSSVEEYSALTTMTMVVFGGPRKMAMLCTSELRTPPSWLASMRFQVSPPSRVRNRPPSSTPTHTSCTSSGSTAIVSIRGRLTPEHLGGISSDVFFQDRPESAERKKAARVGEPVPAYMMLG